MTFNPTFIQLACQNGTCAEDYPGVEGLILHLTREFQSAQMSQMIMGETGEWCWMFYINKGSKRLAVFKDKAQRDVLFDEIRQIAAAVGLHEMVLFDQRNENSNSFFVN